MRLKLINSPNRIALKKANRRVCLLPLYRWRVSAVLLACLLSLFLATGLTPLEASPLNQPAFPDFKVQPLFDGNYRDGSWVALNISVRTTSRPFQGEVRAVLPYTSQSFYTYSHQVDLPANAESHFFFYMLPTRSEPNFDITLYSSSNQQVARKAVQLHLLSTWDYLVGILTDQDKPALPSPGIIKVRQNDTRTLFVPITPGQLPDRSDALSSVDAVLVGKLDPASIRPEQWRTLAGWVQEGGRLWFSGANSFAALNGTADSALLAARSQGTLELNQLAVRILPDTVLPPLKTNDGQTIQVQRLVPQPGAQIIMRQEGGQDELPLVVGRALGQGSLIATAFDLTAPPFSEPQTTNAVWSAIADASNPGPDHAFLRQDFFKVDRLPSQISVRPPLDFPDPLVLLVGWWLYVLIIAPGGYYVFRKLDRPLLALVAIPLVSLVGGFLLWQVGSRQAASEINLTRVAVAAFYDDNAPVEVKTMGVSSGPSASYTLELNSPAQSGTGWLYRPQTLVLPDPKMQSAPPALFVQGASPWQGQLQSVLTPEGKLQGFSGQGTVEGRLNIEANLVVLPDASGVAGTLRNTGNFSLSDVTLVLGNNYFYLGTLLGGEQRQIHFSFEQKANFLPDKSIDTDLYGANIANLDTALANNKIEQWERNLRWITLNAAYLNGRFSERYQNYSLFLTGWLNETDASQLIGNITSPEGLKVRQDDFALVVKPLPFSYRPNSKTRQVLVPSATLVANRSASVNISPDSDGNLKIGPDGSMLLQYRLPPQLNLKPDRFTFFIKSGRGEVGGPQADPRLEIYNWNRQSWEVITEQGDGRNRLDFTTSDLSSYLEPTGGFIRLRASSKDQSLVLQQLNLEVEGEV